MTMDFTDLVLLIGTNPLPNYVAAKYFIEKNSELNRIWMICSEKSYNQESTKNYAESLKDLLKNDKIVFPELIFIKDIGSKSSIESGLEEIIKKKDSKVLLSFTGGTKAMATYSYSYLKYNKKKSFSASYLSARNFKIKYDNEETSDDLRNIVKITFDELCKLHLFKEKVSKADEYECLDNVNSKFKDLIDNNKISDFYSNDGGFRRDIFKINNNRDLEKIFKDLPGPEPDMRKSVNDRVFLEGILNKLKSDEKENFKRRVDILKKILKYEPNLEFFGIIDTFPKELRLYENKKFNTSITKKNYNTAVKFMDGFWFEKYIGKLVGNKFENEFDEILFNKELYKKNDEGNKFELDLVLMKGYQLTGISCTTSKEKHICKEKGFEIILRTRQIGGGEAMAILITRADSEIVSALQSELISSTGTTKKNILVLGMEDWPECKLVEKIKNYCLK